MILLTAHNCLGGGFLYKYLVITTSAIIFVVCLHRANEPNY